MENLLYYRCLLLMAPKNPLRLLKYGPEKTIKGTLIEMDHNILKFPRFSPHYISHIFNISI